MAKVHLRNGKIKTGLAKCGNNGRHYDYGLQCVSPQDFQKVASSNRCSHCEDIFLKERNRQRRAKGLQPVAVWHEGMRVAQ